MKNKKNQNRELYEKILNSTSQEELDDIKILVGGYTCNCIFYPADKTFIFKEGLHSTYIFSGTKYCDDSGYAPGAVTLNNLPSWASYTLIDQEAYYNVYRLSGTAPSYETLPATESDCGVYRYPDVTYEIPTEHPNPLETCSQEINLIVWDLNEPPIVPSFSGEICETEAENGLVLGSITITDTDIKTQSLRYINEIILDGSAADFVDVQFTPGYAPISVNFVLKSVDLLDTVPETLTATIRVRDLPQSNCAPDLLQFSSLGTGNFSYKFIKSNYLPQPNPLGNLYRGKGSLTYDYQIPTGLNTEKSIFLGYANTNDGPDCGPVCVSDSGDDWARVTIIYGMFDSHMDVEALNLDHDFRNMVGIELPSNRSNIPVYTGHFSIAGVGFNNYCCTPTGAEYYITKHQSTEGIGVFRTGIGPDIDFSGGIGNVEKSYFVGGLDQLATNNLSQRGERTYSLNNKLAIIPNDTGTGFGSQENTFFLYTFGQTGIEGITHSSETGIIEADGFDNYIAIRYASSSANTFYKYDISTSSFSTGISPFSSDIRRIISIDDKFWIVGTDESVLFDPSDNSYTGVNHHSFTGVSGIPTNISVVSPYSYKTCSYISQNPNENYVFAVGTGYDGNNNYFPVVLDTENNQILPHASSTYISGIELSGYYLDYYLNYRPDIVQNLHRLIISVENTGTSKTQLLACDMSRTGEMDIVAESPSGKSHKRVSELVNNLILWAGASSNSETVAVDTFGVNQLTSFYDTLEITGAISISKPNYNQFTTLLLNESGDGGYIVSDYDLIVRDSLSFTGSLDMGRYGDIALATGAAGEVDSLGGKPNFLLLPQTTYETNAISGSLVALSTTTTARLDIIFSTGVDDWNIDESILSSDGLNTPGCVDLTGGCCDNTTTPSAIPIGTFVVTDDEFDGGNTLGLPAGYKDNNIFEIIVSPDNTSGTIRIKECITFDYESRQFYTGVVTGVDPYFPNQPPFSKEFVLTINDVDEPPIGINLSPSSLTISASQQFNSDFFISSITVDDPDTETNFQNNEVVIADGVNKQYFRISNDYSQLFIRNGSVFDSETSYTITLMARTVGTTAFTATTTFTLTVGSKSPTGIFLDPITISIDEETPILTDRFLASIRLIDPDSTDQDEVFLTGPDSTYFSVFYTGTSNTGNLYLNSGIDLDFETKASYTGTLNARLIGTTTPVVTRNFILLVNDVEEPSGLIFTPSAVYLDETAGNTNAITLSEISMATPEFQGLPIIITDLAYTTGGYRSALDPFWVLDNRTVSPDFVFLEQRAIDYETQSIYYIRASGYPSGYPNNMQGGTITVLINDVPEPPTITISPTGLTISDATNTDLGDIKLANIKVQDESQSSISLSLTGTDAQFFNIVPSSITTDVPASSIIVGELFLNSGVSLDYDTKNIYLASVVVTDSTDLKNTGTFTLSITDSTTDDTGVLRCYTYISETIQNATCPENNDGYISVEFGYSGDTANTCSFERPLSLDWQNLPSGITPGGGNGSTLYGLSTGTYTAHLLGGTIPITSVSYTVESSQPMQISSVTLTKAPCEASGSITIAFTGGQAPYYIDYGGYAAEILAGAKQETTLSITNNISTNVVIRDVNGCSVSGGPYSFSFPPESNFTLLEQSPPLIHDDVMNTYKFEITHDIGPYEINVYNSVSGEKGSLETTIDRYDTSVLSGVRQLGQEVVDESGNIQVQVSNDLFTNPLIYTYDIGSKIYPGSYVFEFVNQSGCTFLTDLQTASNIEPLSATITTDNNIPIDLGTDVLSQPILDTLFIPYRKIVEDSELLSYISNITNRSDIRFEIGGQIIDRSALYGSVHCGDYSILNIKFLGLESNDWYFTIPFYRGFDLSSADDADILNQDIFLVISESKKVRIVTELNNNINTIKLLKGSLLTTDESVSQFNRNCRDIQLDYLNSDGSFTDIGKAKVGATYTLHNKHVAGHIFMVDFLQNDIITQDLSSENISNVSFDCNTNHRLIQDYRNFVINLNNFDNYENIYFKASNYLQHNGSIGIDIAGGYPDENDDYILSYQYYDKAQKKLFSIKRNNVVLTGETILDNIQDGSYIIKVTDTKGNKLKLVNGISYDSFFSNMIDFIINDLHTTKEAINFEYGDLIVNLYNSLNYTSPPESIPGTDPIVEDIEEEAPPVVITTTTHKVSPNTSYTNQITIQTDPGKVKFRVTGPYGYNKIFDDRVELIQLPPGVYNVEGYEPDLYAKYLYQDKRKIFVNTSTVTIVDLFFDLYENNTIIDNQC